MNVKPGGLAYVVRPPASTGIVSTHPGRVVEVVRQDISRNGRACWVVRAPAPVLIHTAKGALALQEFGAFDCCLRPISGVPVTDDVADEVVA